MMDDSELIKLLQTTIAVSSRDFLANNSQTAAHSGSEDESDYRRSEGGLNVDLDTSPAKMTDQHFSKGARINEGDNLVKEKDDQGYVSLSLLVTMPLDIIYEIFGQLCSQDLLALSRTSKRLRTTLLTRKSTSIWKTARKQQHVPECPPDMSEPSWAALLFGETKCEKCNAEGGQHVNFAFRRRFCAECLKKSVVGSSKFSKRYPNLDKTILDLIPHTYICGYAYKFYLEPDIHTMATMLGTYQKNVDLQIIGSTEKLEIFKAERIRHVDSVIMHAVTCDAWASDMSRQQYDDRMERQARQFEAYMFHLFFFLFFFVCPVVALQAAHTPGSAYIYTSARTLSPANSRGLAIGQPGLPIRRLSRVVSPIYMKASRK